MGESLSSIHSLFFYDSASSYLINEPDVCMEFVKIFNYFFQHIRTLTALGLQPFCISQTSTMTTDVCLLLCYLLAPPLVA